MAYQRDDASHDQPRVIARDQVKQKRLEAEGIIFLRFSDEEVLHDADRTLEKIDAKIEELRMLKRLCV